MRGQTGMSVLHFCRRIPQSLRVWRRGGGATGIDWNDQNDWSDWACVAGWRLRRKRASTFPNP
jgi:hypothetical protein